jgi:hypothetical protein
MIVTNAGRDAVDADGASDEGAASAFAKASADWHNARRSLWRRRVRWTEKSCGPGAPTLVSSWRNFPPATVANKPGHRGEHEGNR